MGIDATAGGVSLDFNARARFATWPHEDDVVQIVLTDHHMVPTNSTVEHWVGHATRSPGVRAIRTGALFDRAAPPFLQLGFAPIDTLALLEARLDQHRRSRSRRGTRQLRPDQLGAAAHIDRLAFGDPWGNDVDSLGAITRATPRHRARAVFHHRELVGFAITGQSGDHGYLQRLAVHPDARRRGVASRLVDDSLHWMQRRGATTAMVNTAIDNDAALGLYAGFGFRRRDEQLHILELSGTSLDRVRHTGRPPT